MMIYALSVILKSKTLIHLLKLEMQRKRMSNFIYFVKSLKLQQVTKSFLGMNF